MLKRELVALVESHEATIATQKSSIINQADNILKLKKQLNSATGKLKNLRQQIDVLVEDNNNLEQENAKRQKVTARLTDEKKALEEELSIANNQFIMQEVTLKTYEEYPNQIHKLITDKQELTLQLENLKNRSGWRIIWDNTKLFFKSLIG